jgi:hypothetical protein
MTRLEFVDNGTDDTLFQPFEYMVNMKTSLRFVRPLLRDAGSEGHTRLGIVLCFAVVMEQPVTADSQSRGVLLI